MAGFPQNFLKIIAVCLGLVLLGDLTSQLITEIFWFEVIDYLPVFSLRVLTQFGLWAIALTVTGTFLVWNLALSDRLRHPHPIAPEKVDHLPGNLSLRWLLPLVLGINLLIGLILLHYAYAIPHYWQPQRFLRGVLFSLSSESIPLPNQLQPSAIAHFLLELWASVWQLGFLLGITVVLIFAPHFWLRAIAVLLTLGSGLILSGHWDQLLLFFNPTAFNQIELVFNRDISFYIFTFPIWKLLAFWLTGIIAYSFLGVLVTYLTSGNSLSQGFFVGFSSAQLRHLYGLLGCLVLTIAYNYWLERYELLYSPQGVVYGASYTDVTAQLPAYTVLSLTALAIALILFWRTLFWFNREHLKHKQLGIKFLLYGATVYLLLAVTGGVVVPLLVQRLIVQPNELERERPYIERTIKTTRQAFKLDVIQTETFDPIGNLTYADVQPDNPIIRNIRLWDTRPLLDTNRQLQQIRLYYKFPDADIDRYTLSAPVAVPPSSERSIAPRPINAPPEKRQVLIAPRELDYDNVPAEAKTWINKHLIYTHGYGFTVSPVNTVAPGGLPDYFIKDITPVATSENVRLSIPIGRPRIYYGELTNTYVMAPTRIQELDYPSGDGNAYNTYGGEGGVSIGTFWRQLLLATYLRDWRMLLTQNFIPESKVLFRRNINQRIRAIAPFLNYDSEPYLVAANPSLTSPTAFNTEDQNYLYWIIDAYTTSPYYPYSDPGQQPFNYIRNSVKVVVDAYNGTVKFYVADLSDPIIRSWSKIFPGLLQSLNQMPAPLRSHIRYPIDFFKSQAEQLMTYHMTDPQVFYNREDQWRAPTEIYDNQPQLVEPYYLITKLPTAPSEEFILLLPFTPAQRNNLIAWLAARSDGREYGNMLLYEFPKQKLVYGTEQIEARINQDPLISEQISLWNRQGSRVIQGNLLVIPIQQSLLYIEPLYLKAEQSSLPTFVRVIVAFENRIVMAENLDAALLAVFQGEETPEPPIVRPVE